MCPCSCIGTDYSCGFFRALPYWLLQVLFDISEKMSWFHCLVKRTDLQRYGISSCKSATGKIYHRGKQSTFNVLLSNLFDALVLLRLHFIILFHTTLLQERERRIGY